MGAVLTAGAVKDSAWATHDAILEMLNLHEAGRQRLGDGGEGSGANSSSPTGGSPSSTGQASPGAGEAVPSTAHLPPALLFLVR
jgi:hypothetical protein